MLNTKYIVLALIVIVLALGAFVFSASHSVYGATTPSTSIAGYFTESLGSPILYLGNAITGPNTTGAAGYLSQVELEGARAALTSTSTTTPCNLQNPFNATSTIQDFAYVITTGNASASQVSLATSSMPNALQSVISTGSVGAGAQASFLVGETASSTGYGVIVPPNGWLVGGSATAVTESGFCSAVFETL